MTLITHCLFGLWITRRNARIVATVVTSCHSMRRFNYRKHTRCKCTSTICITKKCLQSRLAQIASQVPLLILCHCREKERNSARQRTWPRTGRTTNYETPPTAPTQLPPPSKPSWHTYRSTRCDMHALHPNARDSHRLLFAVCACRDVFFFFCCVQFCVVVVVCFPSGPMRGMGRQIVRLRALHTHTHTTSSCAACDMYFFNWFVFVAARPGATQTQPNPCAFSHAMCVCVCWTHTYMEYGCDMHALCDFPQVCVCVYARNYWKLCMHNCRPRLYECECVCAACMCVRLHVRYYSGDITQYKLHTQQRHESWRETVVSINRPVVRVRKFRMCSAEITAATTDDLSSYVCARVRLPRVASSGVRGSALHAQHGRATHVRSQKIVRCAYKKKKKIGNVIARKTWKIYWTYEHTHFNHAMHIGTD